MTTAADTFAAFLDTLSETLDLGSEERARRLHLSRFHLARVVSAAGGEPPERMRRRLLLERAAHRLLTCGDPVVDIAFEAGFGSHEAFTRAFAREYGAAPSRWRQHPTRTRIDGPSGVHFHPPGSLRLPTAREVTPMDLMTRMIEHHVWLTGEMIESAARLSDGAPGSSTDVDVVGASEQAARPKATAEVSRTRCGVGSPGASRSGESLWPVVARRPSA